MIRACIFDLGGTIVDRYSLTSLLSLEKLFKNHNLLLKKDLFFTDIGENKLSYMHLITENSLLMNSFKEKYGSSPDIRIHDLYEQFNELHYQTLNKSLDIIPETKNTINYLQSQGILTAVTTSFNKKTTDLIRDKLETNDIFIDHYISSSCLDRPVRPYPHMIHKIMNEFNIHNPKSVIKIDDTVVGIEEGKNAKCWTIAVARWSINMKINTIRDAYGLPKDRINDKVKECRKILDETDADFVVDTLSEIHDIIDKFNDPGYFNR